MYYLEVVVKKVSQDLISFICFRIQIFRGLKGYVFLQGLNESGKVRGSGFIWKELVIVWIGMEMVKFGYVVKKGVMGFVD